MGIEELIKKMFRSFFVITTGVIASTYVFCRIFNPDASFSLDDIGRILLMALASDFTFFVYYSRREIGKKQMLIRTIIQFLVLSAILLYLAYIWDWISMNIKEVAVFILLITGVYAIVYAVVAYQDIKLAKKLNDNLKGRYHS